MSIMRKECSESSKQSLLSYEDQFFRILQAVSRRRSLIHGRLHAKNGHSCAIGCTFDDGVEVLSTAVVDEVAAYNDSFPKLSEKKRWEKVLAWLRFRTTAMKRRAK